MLNVPFYKNDPKAQQCLQVTMKMVIEYFLDKNYSLDELDVMSGRKGDKWTYFVQILPSLYDMGLDVRLYSKEPLEPFLGDETFFRTYFGKDADVIIEKTDFEELHKSIHQVIKLGLFEQKKMELQDHLDFIDQRHVPIVLLDARVLYQLDGGYRGHFVIITGYDEHHVYYHESGPTGAMPHKKAAKNIFVEALDANGTDNDCVIVKGVRKEET